MTEVGGIRKEYWDEIETMVAEAISDWLDEAREHRRSRV